MQASNPPFIRFCKKLGLLPEKVSFYLSDSFFLLLSLVIAFCISPFGLPLLAELLLNGLADLSGSMWGYIIP